MWCLDIMGWSSGLNNEMKEKNKTTCFIMCVQYMKMLKLALGCALGISRRLLAITILDTQLIACTYSGMVW